MCPLCEQLKKSLYLTYLHCSLCGAIYELIGAYPNKWRAHTAGTPASEEVQAAFRMAGIVESLKVKRHE